MPPPEINTKDLVPVLDVLDDTGILERVSEIKKSVVAELGKIKADKSTIAVVQGNLKQDGRVIRVVTTMDNATYKYLQKNQSKILKIGEILGPEPIVATEVVPGKIKPEIQGKTRLPVHAEQLGIEYADRLGMEGGNVATSALGCTMCESYIKQYYPKFNHLNLKSAGSGGNSKIGSRAVTAVREESKTLTTLENKALNKLTTTATETDKAGAKAAEVTQTVGKIEKVETKVAEAAKAAKRFESISKFGFKGLKLVKTVGKFAFLVMEFIDPLLSLLMAVDVMDSLVDWLQSEKIEEKKEWLRINAFLFGEPEEVKTIYGLSYHASYRETVTYYIENLKISAADYDKNFLFWMDKWNKDTKWSGFVYAQVAVNLERQAATHDNSREKYNVKYYLGGQFDVNLTDKPEKNWKKDTFVKLVGSGDPDNYTTGKSEPRYDPDYNYDVNISKLEVKANYPAPVLTPFDFIIFECRNLLSDIVAFISKYDENIIEGMDVVEEVNGYIKIDWLANYKFASPLDDYKIHNCINLIFTTISVLSTHFLQNGDLKESSANNFNAGHYRRCQILYNLTKPAQVFKAMRLFYYISLQLNNIVTDLSERHLLKPVNPDLRSLTNEYLCESADKIDKHLKRTYEDCLKNSQFEYTVK